MGFSRLGATEKGKNACAIKVSSRVFNSSSFSLELPKGSLYGYFDPIL